MVSSDNMVRPGFKKKKNTIPGAVPHTSKTLPLRRLSPGQVRKHKTSFKINVNPKAVTRDLVL